MPYDRNVESALKLFDSEFELSSVNDCGSSGYVLIGRHKLLDRPAVVKVYGSDESDIGEPSLIAACEHDNIVKIYYACRDHACGNMCYFMERCDADVCNKSIRFGQSIKEILNIIRGVVEGLAYLHCKEPQVLHGDIKPENVLMKDGVAKLCDFGSAFNCEENTDFIPSGTLLFKPPEVFAKKPFYGVVSDLYQVGVLGYYLLGGELDFSLKSYFTNAQKLELARLATGFEKSKYEDRIISGMITAGHLLKWKTLPSFIANRIVRIFKKATAQTGRYTSAADMLLELNNCKDFIDWRFVSSLEWRLEYGGVTYRIVKESAHWVAALCSKSETWRRKLGTKDTSFEGCLRKLKRDIGADRDA